MKILATPRSSCSEQLSVSFAPVRQSRWAGIFSEIEQGPTKHGLISWLQHETLLLNPQVK
jgi:hypothetical protein